jgi:cytochrome P450
MNQLLLEVIERQRKEPEETITSALIDAEAGGARLTNEEISIFLRQFVSAGLDTTYRATGSLLFYLLTHPDQLQALYTNHPGIDAAVEEALRMSPPAGVAPRVALRDTQLAGVDIPAGSGILVSFASANYDPTRWPEPFTFDIHRRPERNLTFGSGPHTCLGIGLARAQIRHALRRILEMLPNLRPDPGKWPGPELVGWGFRGPTALPALWDVT